jgi:formamidopyrimidine-DNA glycosylase
MPEAPDVEIYTQYFADKALKQEILEVDITDTKILDEISKKTLTEWLKGKKFTDCKRYGKYLLAETNDSDSLYLHFGMTGYLEYFKTKKEAPKHARILFHLKSGHTLTYMNQRLLGHVGKVNSVEDLKKVKDLGPDLKEIAFEEFSKTIQTSRAAVKTGLMNQKYFCGIGNIYSDEILYQAGIHPETKCSDLSEKEIKTLYEKMHEVFKIAVEKGANPQRMPDSFLLHHRDSDQNCPKKGHGKLKSKKVSGRRAWFCPNCQKDNNPK